MFGKKIVKDEEFDDEIELEGQEAPQNLVAKIQYYIDNNRNQVLYISGGVILLTVLFFVVKSIVVNNMEENGKKATLCLSRIQPYYSAFDYNKALKGDSANTVRGERIIGLLEIINEYGSTDAGKLAALYAGNCYLNMNQANQAIDFFEKATGSDSKTIQGGAYAGIGACYEQQKNYKDAAAKYEKASSLVVSDAAQGKYKLYAGMCLEKIGEKEKAGLLYKEVVTKNENTEIGGYAKLGLLRLGMIIE